MEIPIIYEDKSILVVDKPSGIVVNTSESTKTSTLQDWAFEKLELKGTYTVDNDNDFFKRAGIVHRLDKETSGILIIAKNPSSFVTLQSQFKERTVEKRYLALVHGVLAKTGEIKASVGRLPWNRERFGVLAGGREAYTTFKLLEIFKREKEEDFSLVEVYPHTGRTHQIRIHFKYIGHPVISDPFYGGRKVYRKDILLCPRLFLHASYLKLKSPETGGFMEFKSDLPNDLNMVLISLRRTQKP